MRQSLLVFCVMVCGWHSLGSAFPHDLSGNDTDVIPPTSFNISCTPGGELDPEWDTLAILEMKSSDDGDSFVMLNPVGGTWGGFWNDRDSYVNGHIDRNGVGESYLTLKAINLHVEHAEQLRCALYYLMGMGTSRQKRQAPVVVVVVVIIVKKEQ